MSIPEPKQALEGHCSTIDNNTLYVYSPSGLQSLQLKENATWVEEKSGKSVTGATCVKATSGDDPALYVIGGETDDEEYTGLQRYVFGSKTWETLSPPGYDLKGRTNHSAAYLSHPEAILVYAGSTPEAPSLLSSQTFLISTTEPYNIESFVSGSAAPANQPILLPWNERQAVMAGGSPSSNVIYTFDRESGWQQLGTNLSEPLDPGVRANVIQGIDGSKVLQTYDMASSPNKITQTVLLLAGGETAPNGQIIGQKTSSNNQKRDLTLEDWPNYNSTNAPSASRSDYAVAQDPEGMVVLSGGNEDEPVAMFDQNENSWVDAGKFFGAQKMENQQPLMPSTTNSESTPSATSSAEPEASTTTASITGGPTAHEKSMRTLGITLGTLCGIAALVLIALLYLRWRKSKKAKIAAAAGNDDEKRDRSGERLSFVDRGASFMKEAGGSATDLGVPPRHRFDPNAAGSHSSLAIIGGKFGNKRNSQAPRGSFESTTNLVKDKNGGEPMEMMDIGEKNNHLSPHINNATIPSLNVLAASPEDRRTSGWSKYFSTSQPKELEHMPAAYAQDRESVASQWPSSNAQSTSDVSRIPSSILVPPLDVDFSKTVDGQRLSNVIAHSPSFADSREDLASRGSTVQGQQGQIEDGDRPISGTNTVSSYDRSTMSSDYYNNMSSINSPWTPFSNGNEQRPTSSVYTESIADRRIPSRAARSQGGSGFFPGSGNTPRVPAKLKISHEPKESAEWPSANDASKDSPLLNSPPAMRSPAYPPPAHDRASTATVFPHQAPGNRWTANVSKDTLMSREFAPPRAPGLMGGAQPAAARDSTVTVFPNEDRSGNWSANQSKDTLAPLEFAPPRAPGLMGGAKPAAARDSTVTVFPNADGSGNWSANSKANLGDELRPPGALGDAHAANDRDSTLTMFPRGVPSAYYANRPKEIDDAEAGKKPMGSDMSWLNLGDNAGPGAVRR